MKNWALRISGLFFLGFMMIAFLIFSCDNLYEKKTKEIVRLLPYDERFIYLTDTTETYLVSEAFEEFWHPTDSQQRLIDHLIRDYIAEHSEPYETHLQNEPFERYYRQYIAYVNRSGDSIIYLNAACDLGNYEDSGFELDSNYLQDVENWKKNLILIDDGGDCFWQIEINYSKNKVIWFMVNTSI